MEDVVLAVMAVSAVTVTGLIVWLTRQVTRR
jgi:hypothetical protein